MIQEQDVKFVNMCLDRFAAGAPLLYVAKTPPFDAEDGGVPPEMFDGEVDADGYVKWKMLPSTVTEQQVHAIEQVLPWAFPPLFRAFLCARFIMGIETPRVRLPALPSDNPLDDILLTLRAWQPLFPAGYVAFAEHGNGSGPLCFDMNNRLADGDCPIVAFDHEELISLGQEEAGRREQVLPLAKPAYASFRELLENVFT